MKKFFSVAIFSALALTAKAAGRIGVKLDVSMKLNGEKVDTALVTDYGKTASIRQVDKNGNGFEITVQPDIRNPQSLDAISMKLSIAEIKSNNSRLVANSKVATVLNATAKLDPTDVKNANDQLEFQVTPRKAQ